LKQFDYGIQLLLNSTFVPAVFSSNLVLLLKVPDNAANAVNVAADNLSNFELRNGRSAQFHDQEILQKLDRYFLAASLGRFIFCHLATSARIVYNFSASSLCTQFSYCHQFDSNGVAACPHDLRYISGRKTRPIEQSNLITLFQILRRHNRQQSEDVIQLFRDHLILRLGHSGPNLIPSN